jgi:CHAD domain-containing protein
MESQRYLDLLDRLHAGAQRPPFLGKVPPSARAERVLPSLVDKQWRSLRRRARETSNPPLDAELHRIRIGAKQLRYASEAAIPVIGRPAARTARAAEKLQTVLGEHHDAVNAEAWLRNLAGSDPALGFHVGWLAATQRQRQIEKRRRWQKRLDVLAKRKPTNWRG